MCVALTIRQSMTQREHDACLYVLYMLNTSIRCAWDNSCMQTGIYSSNDRIMYILRKLLTTIFTTTFGHLLLTRKSISALSTFLAPNQYFLRTGYTVLLGMRNMVVCATLDLMYVVLVPVDM